MYRISRGDLIDYGAPSGVLLKDDCENIPIYHLNKGFFYEKHWYTIRSAQESILPRPLHKNYTLLAGLIREEYINTYNANRTEISIKQELKSNLLKDIENWGIISKSVSILSYHWRSKRRSFKTELVSNRRSSSETYVSSHFSLIDTRTKFIAYSLTIKREFTEHMKYCLILEEEPNPEWFEFLVDPIMVKRGKTYDIGYKNVAKKLVQLMGEWQIPVREVSNIKDYLYNVAIMPDFSKVEDLKSYLSNQLEEYKGTFKTVSLDEVFPDSSLERVEVGRGLATQMMESIVNRTPILYQEPSIDHLRNILDGLTTEPVESHENDQEESSSYQWMYNGVPLITSDAVTASYTYHIPPFQPAANPEII